MIGHTETDPVAGAAGYLTTETDPVASVAGYASGSSVTANTAAIALNTAKDHFPGFGTTPGKALEGNTNIPSLAGYATESWVTGKGYLTSYTETDPVASVAASINATNISTNYTAIAANNAKVSFPGFGTMAGEALEADSLDGYATESWVADKIVG